MDRTSINIIWGEVNGKDLKPIEGLKDGSYRYVFEKNRPARVELPENGLAMNILVIDGKWFGITAEYAVLPKTVGGYKVCSVHDYNKLLELVERLKNSSCDIVVNKAGNKE